MEKVVIGDCTLYLGDCHELLRRGVFGEVGGIITDPPYGINLKIGSQKNQKISCQKNMKPIHGDDKPFDPNPWIDYAPVYKDEKRIALMGADYYMQGLPKYGTMLAWDKHLGRAPDDSFADCEWIWCGRGKLKREVFRYLWKGICSTPTTLDVSPAEIKGSGKGFSRVHISQKPVELMRWLIDKVRPIEGLPILDPFMGSGTTAIAALSLGKTFVGCEIDEEHFRTA